jgi:uncharacterized tellurite resistance protein B-like protein
MTILVPEGLRHATDEKLHAILELMYLVARADGVFSHEELSHFISVGSTISGGRIDAARLAILVEAWGEQTSSHIENRIIEISHVLTTAHEREMACNLAAQLAEADDAVLRPEQKVLDLMGRVFFGSP